MTSRNEPVKPGFFDQPPLELAPQLLGKVLRHQYTDPVLGELCLSAQIIETEAYDINETGSHSSLGFTEKRAALFMAPGTIYMYYARGNDSLNFSARGRGNGVLIKSGFPYIDAISPEPVLQAMRTLNPSTKGSRPLERLCNGQTLICRSLNLKVNEWNQQQMDDKFMLFDVGYLPTQVIQCRRLGIPQGRDEHLPYRFVDFDYAANCTANPLTKRDWRENHDYWLRDA